ncbi:hypothetical protein HMPREF9597_01565 [Cutibacterium acnes HL005PA4]|nr:hypothetical protein HMPREF9597_01565 [Cutibacterium acnes HL005PA4]EFS82298.1 hypothetical protein HMPREF9598_01108 [Cutibacterium acnes HL050PA1]EFT20003.1 hypothetical protein HMPREF9566_01928 [Cutibacterium acnes HL045PA1]
MAVDHTEQINRSILPTPTARIFCRSLISPTRTHSQCGPGKDTADMVDKHEGRGHGIPRPSR